MWRCGERSLLTRYVAVGTFTNNGALLELEGAWCTFVQ